MSDASSGHIRASVVLTVVRVVIANHASASARRKTSTSVCHICSHSKRRQLIRRSVYEGMVQHVADRIEQW